MSCSEWELGGGAEDEVRLDLKKIRRLTQRALHIHQKGFATPLPASANGNRYDAAYTELARRTAGSSHMQRTGDADAPVFKAKCRATSVEKMLFGVDAEVHNAAVMRERAKNRWGKSCAWYPHVKDVLRSLDL